MTRCILFLIVAELLFSCNSYKTIDNNVITNMKRYEQSAKEITACFDTLFYANGFNEKDGSVKMLYNSSFKEDTNAVFSTKQTLLQTRKLCLDSLVERIYLKWDTTIVYNTFSSQESFPGTPSYRHFFCFSPNDKKINLDLFHAFKIIVDKKIKADWTYIIIEQGWD